MCFSKDDEQKRETVEHDNKVLKKILIHDDEPEGSIVTVSSKNSF